MPGAKGKYMIPKSPISEKQVLQMFQRTPPQHVKTRPGKGGGQWSFVTGVYVKKVLNYTFGWLWDFQIIDKGREGNQVWVQGRLTIKNEKLEPILVKEQFGGADIKFKKGTKNMLDYPNDLKAASTDALKKCASEIGIANDIYGANEFKGIQEEPPIKKSVKRIEETQNKQPVNYLDQVKERLLEEGAKTDGQAMKLLKNRTGIVWKSYDGITQKQAQMALGALLNN